MKTIKNIKRTAINAARLVAALATYYFTRQSVMIHGAPGVGKSQIVRQVARMFGIQYRDVRLTLLDPVDLRGLPRVTDGITSWATPDFLATIDPDSKGILHLDEFNSARPDVQAACYSLLLDRRLGDWTLPDGWMVVACGNRVEDRAFVHAMSSANADRMIHFDLEVDNATWHDHAAATDFHLCVRTFIKFKPAYLHDFDPTRLRNATPRKWEKMSDLCHAFDAMPTLDNAVAEDLFFAALPEHIAVDFYAFWRMFTSIPLIDDIETNPTTTPLPDSMSARYATVSALASRIVATKDDIDRSRELFDAHMTFIRRISADFTRLYLTLISTTCPEHPVKQTRTYIEYEIDRDARTNRTRTIA